MRAYWRSLGLAERVGVVVTVLVAIFGAYIAIGVALLNAPAHSSPTTTTATYPLPDNSGHTADLYGGTGNTGCSDPFGINC